MQCQPTFDSLFLFCAHTLAVNSDLLGMRCEHLEATALTYNIVVILFVLLVCAELPLSNNLFVLISAEKKVVLSIGNVSSKYSVGRMII